MPTIKNAPDGERNPIDGTEATTISSSDSTLSWWTPISRIKDYIITIADALYAAIGHTHSGLVTNGNTHDHAGGDGAAITDANLSTSDITTNNATTSKHGFTPKLSGDSDTYLNGDGEWTTPAGSGNVYDSDIIMQDITTNNADSDSHGFLLKLSMETNKFLRADGGWQLTPAAGSVSDSDVAFTDITTGNASASMHGFLPKLSGDSDTYLNGDGEFTTPSGGSTLLRNMWNTLAPPASATSQDDEFDNGSLDGKWTEFDPNNVLTVTENSTTKGIDLLATTHSAFQLTGIYQTLPAGDFTIWTRVSAMGQNVNYLLTGLALWEDPSDTSKDLQVASISPRNAGITVSVLDYNDYQNIGPTRWEAALSPNNSMAFLRIRRNSTNYYWEISSDGVGWFGTGVLNPSFTPTKMGIFIDNSQGITCKSFFPFFRYVASDVGVTGVMNGRATGIYL